MIKLRIARLVTLRSFSQSYLARALACVSIRKPAAINQDALGQNTNERAVGVPMSQGGGGSECRLEANFQPALFN